MRPNSEPSEPNRSRAAFNLTLAAVAGQVGCLTLVIVLAALFGGLWLDAYFQTKPVITIILMISSVPLTLVMMFWVVRSATSRLQAGATKDIHQPQEDVFRGKDA